MQLDLGCLHFGVIEQPKDHPINMAKNLVAGTDVYVPLPALDLDLSYPSAFYRTKILDVASTGGKVCISLPRGDVRWVHSNTVYRSIQFLVVTIGDFKTEETLLKPLAKSITSFLRILIPGDQLIYKSIRTPAELKYLWIEHAAATSHLIVVGHGESDGLIFVEREKLTADKVKGILTAAGDPKFFLSLCCNSGNAPFAKEISGSAAFQAFVGPSKSLHGCVGAQFAHTFLSFLMLTKHLPPSAWRRACESTAIDSGFAYWSKGRRIS